MSKIKIFVDCHVFDGGFQGTTTYLKGLYSELILQGDKHFYLASHNIPKLEAQFGKYPNVTYISYRSKNKFIRLLIEIPFLIKKHRIDFAHFQYIVSPIKYCKYIVTTHDVLFIDFPEYFPWLSRIKNTFLYKLSARRADILLTVSKYSKKQITQHFGLRKIYITYNGVDPIFFSKYDKAAVKAAVGKKYGLYDYIIYISRWEPRKNQYLLLRNFIELGLYNSHNLVFIGDQTFTDPRYDDYYNSLTQGQKSKIYMFSKVGFSEMLELLRGAEASVYPSIAEGFGIPPLEAVAAGIPTIVSNTTAMAEFEFLKKWSFNPDEEHEFRKKLSLILKAKSEDFQTIKDIVHNRYNWKNAAITYNEAISAY